MVKLKIFCEVGITIEEIAIYFRNYILLLYFAISMVLNVPTNEITSPRDLSQISQPRRGNWFYYYSILSHTQILTWPSESFIKQASVALSNYVLLKEMNNRLKMQPP